MRYMWASTHRGVGEQPMKLKADIRGQVHLSQQPREFILHLMYNIVPILHILDFKTK